MPRRKVNAKGARRCYLGAEFAHEDHDDHLPLRPAQGLRRMLRPDHPGQLGRDARGPDAGPLHRLRPP
ncbi:hypothetical protein MTBLM5_510002 [Magnetospirillum sp. LM-5]|nr:hypothetical protein MTBLM5_510002 [Magnetospirillum sp. LM-5]